MATPLVSHVLRMLIMENKKKNLVLATRHRALSFGMQHNLEDLYQIYLNYATGSKKSLPQESPCFTYAYIGSSN